MYLHADWIHRVEDMLLLGSGRYHVVDISVPDGPRLLTRESLGWDGTPCLWGRFMLFSTRVPGIMVLPDSFGTTVYDIGDPLRPTAVDVPVLREQYVAACDAGRLVALRNVKAPTLVVYNVVDNEYGERAAVEKLAGLTEWSKIAIEGDRMYLWQEAPQAGEDERAIGRLRVYDISTQLRVESIN